MQTAYFIYNNKRLDLSIPLDRQCPDGCTIIVGLQMKYKMIYNNRNCTFNYCTNITLRDLRQVLSKPLKLKSSATYFFKIDGKFLSIDYRIPFEGISHLIYLYEADMRITVMYKSKSKEFLVNKHMLVRDVTKIVYNSFIGTDPDKGDLESYHLILNDRQLRYLNENSQLVQESITSSSVLQFDRCFYINDGSSSFVILEGNRSRVSDLLQVIVSRDCYS